ncbi:hypothetical protein HanPSC8_Chr10g0429031 [Helianthus annuus]|nr:hypothetical protein HanPSC8_Chr10g0429031 [Helianthus annuus]
MYSSSRMSTSYNAFNTSGTSFTAIGFDFSQKSSIAFKRSNCESFSPSTTAAK